GGRRAVRPPPRRARLRRAGRREVQPDPPRLEQPPPATPTQTRPRARPAPSPPSSTKIARNASGAFVTRRDSNPSPSSSKAATYELLRCRSMPTHSTTVSLPELTTPAQRRQKTDSGGPPRHDINQAVSAWRL